MTVRIVVRIGVLACALASAGCAPGIATLHRPGPDQLPSGSPLLITNLDVGDAWLRHHLMVGDPGAALALFGPDEPAPVDAGTADKIERILQMADLHLAVDRLLQPPGSNAAEAYAAVAELQPGNRQARRGLELVAARVAAHRGIPSFREASR